MGFMGIVSTAVARFAGALIVTRSVPVAAVGMQLHVCSLESCQDQAKHRRLVLII